MTRWVRWGTSKWHVLSGSALGAQVSGRCGAWTWSGNNSIVLSDFEPIEDECRLCRRVLDGGKTT